MDELTRFFQRSKTLWPTRNAFPRGMGGSVPLSVHSLRLITERARPLVHHPGSADLSSALRLNGYCDAITQEQESLYQVRLNPFARTGGGGGRLPE